MYFFYPTASSQPEPHMRNITSAVSSLCMSKGSSKLTAIFTICLLTMFVNHVCYASLNERWQLSSVKVRSPFPFFPCPSGARRAQSLLCSLINTSLPNMPPKKNPRRKRYDCFIWPKDAKIAGKAKPLLRFLDLLSGKGPDIFIGTLSTLESRPRRAACSQWSYLERGKSVKTASGLPFWCVDRSPTQSYDFRTREYKEWTPEWNPAPLPPPRCCSISRHNHARNEEIGQFQPNERSRDVRCNCDDCRAYDAHERQRLYGAAPATLLCHECQCPYVHVSDYRCEQPNEGRGPSGAQMTT